MKLSRRAMMLGSGAVWASVAHAYPREADGVLAARDTLRRLIGTDADRIDLKLTPAEHPYWRLAPGARLSVEGSSPVALVRGVCDALSQAGVFHVAWDGRRVAPHALKALTQPLEARSPYKVRAYLNPCTYGYTTPFWGEAEWDAEIDWMAAHGIDMPLAMEGQEWVWRELWRAEGLSNADLAAYFSGPAFMPWQRMGNIEGYRGPVPDSFFAKKRDLQNHILGRMRALHMTPVLPGFAGYVPKAFALKHPQARITRMVPWGGFKETYWLDPADPLFATLSKRYLDLYEATYGKGSHWLVDAFNEMLPPVSDTPGLRDAQLKAYGQALHSALSNARPDTVFVMQGWMFSYQAAFWTAEAIAAFLSGMPDERTLILDLANDSYPGTWERANAYSGKPWLFGYVQNFGGNNPLTGDLELYRKDLTGLPGRNDTGRLAGIGLFPEGLHANPLVYAYLTDQAWMPNDEPLAQWLGRYAQSRYGRTSPEMTAALAGIAQAFYRTRNWDFGWQNGFGQYLLCKRPKPELAQTKHPDDLSAGRGAVKAVLDLWPAYGASPLYRHDVISFLVHLSSLVIDRDLIAIMTGYGQDHTADADALWTQTQSQVADLDLLLGEQPDTLSSWLSAARRYGDTPAEADYYLDDAWAQVTVWGGDNVLNDYASKAWQGLYDDFYRRRWGLYFDALRAGPAGFDAGAVTRQLIAFDDAWVARREVTAVRRPSDPHALALTVFERITA